MPVAQWSDSYRRDEIRESISGPSSEPTYPPVAEERPDRHGCLEAQELGFEFHWADRSQHIHGSGARERQPGMRRSPLNSDWKALDEFLQIVVANMRIVTFEMHDLAEHAVVADTT
jgi:hypothetical protein